MLKKGIYDGLSNEEYHGDRSHISSSGLKLMLRSPRDYYERYILNINNFKGSDAMDLGTYVHTLVLEPELEDDYVFFDGKRQGKKWEEFKEEFEDSGKMILPRTAREKGFYCADSVKKHALSQELLQEGEPELTCCTTLDGVDVKVRFDWLNDCHITDLKTSYKSDSLQSIESIIQERDYDLSAALYCDAYEKIRGIKPKFSFVFVSTSTFKTIAVDCSEELLENGRRKYKCAIEKLKKAKETGNWEEAQLTERPILQLRDHQKFYRD